MINYRQAYEKGLECLEKKNYAFARYYFKISLQSRKFREESICKLILVELKAGDFLSARQMLDESLLNSKIIGLYALLENIENNYEQSKKYYEECMLDPETKDTSRLSIANLNIQTADYEVSKSIFESLRTNPKFFAKASLSLVFLSMLKHDYLEVKKIMSELDISKFSYDMRKHCKIVRYYISYFLGELRYEDCDCDSKLTYMISRLFDSSEEVLINHIKRHANQDKKYTDGCFFEDINFESFLSLIRNKIENMNANHFGFTDYYRFRLEYPIGYKSQIITNDICVTTVVGTKDIITTYPIKLSDQFDKEGFMMSDELRLKRQKSIII